MASGSFPSSPLRSLFSEHVILLIGYEIPQKGVYFMAAINALIQLSPVIRQWCVYNSEFHSSKLQRYTQLHRAALKSLFYLGAQYTCVCSSWPVLWLPAVPGSAAGWPSQTHWPLQCSCSAHLEKWLYIHRWWLLMGTITCIIRHYYGALLSENHSFVIR